VVVSCGKYSEALTKENTAKNIHFRSFVNQRAIMKQAKLFITAGGMNSLCEAVSNNVPCLMYPMQGEQYINCKNIEKLRLGKMLKTNKAILPQVKELINLGKISAEDFTNIKMSELIERIYKYIETSEA
jgi:UDP:flavonoid glycosyltransferase YjiC (YdhE family)